MRHETSVFALALAAAAIPAAVALPLVWTGSLDLKTQVTLTLLVALSSFGLAYATRIRVQRPLQTVSNVISALRERDYSVRARHPRKDDALGLTMSELAGLAEQLREERWRDEEAAAGLARVVEGLDAAVLAIDDRGRVQLANRTAERLVGGELEGRTVRELGIEHLFAVDVPRTVELSLPGAAGTWEVRPSDIRLSGMPHKLIVMTDVQHALRAEERQAWQRLVRVLGHEINNSLGPIASIAETLRTGLGEPRRDDLDDDLARGLEIIERRAAALSRFMQSYARLVRLPPPRIGRVEVAGWVARTAALETRTKITIAGGPDVIVPGDPDQLDQMLINLVHNAVEASAETGAPAGGVTVSWRVAGGALALVVEDDGPGVADTTNLFVPFFTTKPTGSGIGLVLARQIAEAHGGTLVVRNRKAARGAEAVITLPATAALDRAS
ncbi:MAG TPA: ATP-binding protein [Kofleriaceae bacterium]|nr:ATP-binding protein [Kofleriaceae bacterium]